jgi:peroxiredoxin
MYVRDMSKGHGAHRAGLILIAACLISSLAWSSAQEPQKEPSVRSTAAEPSRGPSTELEAQARVVYQRLIERRESQLINYNYIIPGKRTKQRREEAFRQYYPHPKDWAPRFFGVQNDFPGTVAAGRSLAWIVRHFKDSELELKSRSILLKDYLGQPFLFEICRSLGQAKQPRGKQDLLFLFQHSPIDRVKAHACQALCDLGMDALQMRGSPVLRGLIDGYVQALGTRFAAVQISGVVGAAWAERYRLELNHLSLGQRVLDWQGEDLNGVTRSLSDTRGHVVLLYFWKSGSKPARLALPHVLGLQNQYADKPFQVFGISGDLNRKKAMRWQSALQLKFPNWHIPSTAQAPGLWGVTSWPSFYVLSSKGRILAARVDWADARKTVIAAFEEMSRNKVLDAPLPDREDSPGLESPAAKKDPETEPGIQPKEEQESKDQGPLRRKDP